jgi:hypothetical protein
MRTARLPQLSPAKERSAKNSSWGDRPMFYTEAASGRTLGQGANLRVESGFEPRGDYKSAQGTNRIGLSAPCACSRARL